MATVELDTGLVIIFSAFSFIFGAVFASFSGVVAFRMPQKLSVIKPGSYCPACGYSLTWYDNIPILSYIILRGRCRKCGAEIGVFSLLCEIFGGVFYLLAFLSFNEGYLSLYEFILLLIFIQLSIVISCIDHDSHVIYNNTIVLMMLFCAAIAAARYFAANPDFSQFGAIVNVRSTDSFMEFVELPAISPIFDSLFGSILGFTSFYLIKILSEALLGREALGSGDIWIVGAGGLLLGSFNVLIAVLFATVVGSVIELIRMKVSNKSDKNIEIAFAPYLLFGILIMAVCGQFITNLYWEVIL